MAYRELLQRDRHVACVWLRDAEAQPRRHRVLPDACVDVVWTDGRLLVAGPATGPVVVELPAGTASMGVRFRVGAAGAALGVPAGELLDSAVALEELWGADGTQIAETVGSAATPAAQLTALAAAVRRRLAGEPDRLVRAAATGAARHELGIGDRQLRRRFADAVGYGPKTLERILRFQRFLALATTGDEIGRRHAITGAEIRGRHEIGRRREITGGHEIVGGGRPRDLAGLAFEAGYADQAHLTRECSRLAGLPPAALLASGAGPAGETSVSFKTSAPRPATMAA
jgi:AraC-like DNA-binding protein